MLLICKHRLQYIFTCEFQEDSLSMATSYPEHFGASSAASKALSGFTYGVTEIVVGNCLPIQIYQVPQGEFICM